MVISNSKHHFNKRHFALLSQFSLDLNLYCKYVFLFKIHVDTIVTSLLEFICYCPSTLSYLYLYFVCVVHSFKSSDEVSSLYFECRWASRTYYWHHVVGNSQIVLMVLGFWWSNSVINSWLSVDGMELIFTGFVCYCALDLWLILFITHQYILCCWVVFAQHWTFLFFPSSLLQRIGKRMGGKQPADLTQIKLKDIL